MVKRKHGRTNCLCLTVTTEIPFFIFFILYMTVMADIPSCLCFMTVMAELLSFYAI